MKYISLLSSILFMTSSYAVEVVINGNVKQSDGTPISNAEFKVENYSIKSDQFGCFYFSRDLPEKRINMSMVKNGFNKFSEELMINDDNNYALLTITLYSDKKGSHAILRANKSDVNENGKCGFSNT